jgi:hypothetical protein
MVLLHNGYSATPTSLRELPQGENPQREERLRKICFVFLCGLTLTTTTTTSRGATVKLIPKKGICLTKNKNNMENIAHTRPNVAVSY